MRRSFTLRTILTSATVALFSASAVSAQFDDDPLALTVDGVRTGVVLNATTDASLNRVIDQEARDAHEAIGGEIRSNPENRNNGFFESTQPESRSVVEQAVELADAFEDAIGPSIMVIDGGDSDSSAAFVARYPRTTFIDLGQPVPCVTPDGRRDPSGECLGGVDALPFGNYSVVTFEVEDPAYLAGVVAASASRNDRLGIISGMPGCEECNRYIQGFIRGAQSIEPDIDIELAFLADDSEAVAFGDPTSAKTFAEAFIDVHQPDVLLPIAKDASTGMIEAACDAGILAVGTGVDVSRLHPQLEECVLASITRDVATAVRHSIYDFSTGELPRHRSMTLTDDGVALTEEWQTRSALPGGLTDQFNDAMSALITGETESCPTACGEPYGPVGPIDLDAGPEPEAAEETEAG